MNDDDMSELAGSKARNMSDEMKFVLAVQKALLTATNGAEVDMIFHKAEQEASCDIKWVDRIGVLMQTVLLLDIGSDAYSRVVDLFLEIVKNAPVQAD